MAKKKAASKAKHQEASSDLDFEQSLREVEEIVSQLEGGQLGLSESLDQYELGIRRLKRCHELLDAAEQRVSVLAGFDAEGNPVEEPLSEAAAGRRSSKASRRTSDSNTGDSAASEAIGREVEATDDSDPPASEGLF